MDNMQISLRMCADPADLHFRKVPWALVRARRCCFQDVEAFHCLSPKLGISYQLRRDLS